MTDSTDYVPSSVVFTVISSTAVSAEVVQDQPTLSSVIIHVGLKGDKGEKGDRGLKGEVGDINPLTILYAEQAEASAQSAGLHAASANTERIAAETARSEAQSHKDAAETAALTSTSMAAEAALSAAAAATFDPANYVPKTGGEYTGHVSVPANAVGNQAPRRNEVVGLTGNELIGGVKSFSSRPKVPAGATADEVPQAQEIFGKAQSWSTVSRTPGATYTNSTGKPILVQLYGTTSNVAGFLAISVDGALASIASYSATSGAALGVNAVVPSGSTYGLTVNSMATAVVREYR